MGEFGYNILLRGIQTKETTVELQQIVKHTFQNTTYNKPITFPFTMY